MHGSATAPRGRNTPARTAGPGDPAKDRTDGIASSGLPRRRRVRQPFEPASPAVQLDPEGSAPGEPPADLFTLLSPRRTDRQPLDPAADAHGNGAASWDSAKGGTSDPDAITTEPLADLRGSGAIRWRRPSAISAEGARGLRERLRMQSPRSRMVVLGAVGAVAVVAAVAALVASVGPIVGPAGHSGARAPGALAGAGGMAGTSASSVGGPNGGANGPAASRGHASSPHAEGGRAPAANPAVNAPPGAPVGGSGQRPGATPSPAQAASPAAGGASSPSASASVSAPPSTAAVAVSGVVNCSSGAAVVGVWVQATSGSGWASLTDAGAYDFTLPESESYSLHVGCGGTSASWKIAVYSPYVLGTANSFDCHDVPGGTDYKTCEPV